MQDVLNFFTYQTDGTFDQEVTADAISTDVIDLDVVGISIQGSAKPTYIVIWTSDTAFLTTVSIEIQLISDTTAALTGAPLEIQVWRFVLAQLGANQLLVNQALPVGDYARFLGLNFNVFTNATAGGFVAYLQDGPETPQTVQTLELAGS